RTRRTAGLTVTSIASRFSGIALLTLELWLIDKECFDFRQNNVCDLVRIGVLTVDTVAAIFPVDSVLAILSSEPRIAFLSAFSRIALLTLRSRSAVLSINTVTAILAIDSRIALFTLLAGIAFFAGGSILAVDAVAAGLSR